ncbi:MAG: ABC transporter permease [Actinobacteria bacterium]|nr:ABC transporter permease [Actinomycetota bacterium]
MTPPVKASRIERHPAPEGRDRMVAEQVPRDGRTRGVRRGLAVAGIPLLVLVVFFAVWEFASKSGWQPDYILPAPSDVANDLWKDRGGYWDNAQTTLTEILIGFPIGLVLGLVIGGLIGMVASLRRTAYPFVVASQSLPTLALAPLLVLWFGFGVVPKVILVVQVVFFPITVATVAGLVSVPQQALVFGRTLGAGWWQLFVKIRVPASLPHVFSGLKIAASYAAVAAVIAEFAGAESGLGALMLRANDNLQTEAVFGALILITAIGVGFFALMSLLERLIVPWHEQYRKDGDR